MFGLRRRHRKQNVVPATSADASSPSPVSLSEDQLFDAIKGKLDEFMGVDGTWALVRRDPERPADDTIFAWMATFSLAREITGTLVSGPRAATPETTDEASTRAASTDRALQPVPATGDERDRIAIELTTIAKWADPQRHDPDYVDPGIVSPVSARAAERGVHSA